MAFDNGDPTRIVTSYMAATAAGDTEQAGRLARSAARLGQELRATVARCEHDRGRCHESTHDDIWVEEDLAGEGLRILEGIPALKAAIDMLDADEVSRIWAEHGALVDTDEDA
jgi:hypothetical protein